MSLAHRLILLFNSLTIVTSILTGCYATIDPKTAGATAAAATGQDYLVAVKDRVPLYVLGPQELALPNAPHQSVSKTCPSPDEIFYHHSMS
jgi:hypothetical protein